MTEPATSETAVEAGTSWRRVLRLVAGISAALVLLQAVLAGQMLGSGANVTPIHEWGGHILFALSIVLTVAAIVAWRRQQVPAWVAVVAPLTFVLITAQIFAGYARLLDLHVPLGVALFGITLVLWLGTTGRR